MSSKVKRVILCHVILKRIKNELGKPLKDEQYEFHLDCSYAHIIFTLRVITGKSREWSSKLSMIFIDFEKIFDSVDWTL